MERGHPKRTRIPLAQVLIQVLEGFEVFELVEDGAVGPLSQTPGWKEVPHRQRKLVQKSETKTDPLAV